MVQKRKQSLNRIVLLVTLFCMLGNSITAMAADESRRYWNMTQVTIEEADMTMQVPSSCHLLTQNIEEDDPYLQKVGADRETIQNYYKESGIVLNAIAPDDTYEIVVTMNESNHIDYVYNLHSLTKEQMQQLAETIQTTYASYGYEVDGYELYQTEQASYILFSFSQLYGEQKVQCSQFYTIRNSRIYNITLRSYTGEITKELETIFRQVADSTTYTDTGNNVFYGNEDYGVSFLLAGGWEASSQAQDNPYLQTQYVHANELGESIQFFCMDIWGDMNAFHRLFNSRESLTMKDGMTNADKNKYKSYVSGFFSEYGSVSFKQFGENWYLISEMPKLVTDENTEGTYLQKSAVSIQNGFLYAFQYGYYEKANLHEADFEELLKKVSYENPQIVSEDGKYYEDIAGMVVKIVILAVLIVAMLAVIIYLYHKGSEEKKL